MGLNLASLEWLSKVVYLVTGPILSNTVNLGLAEAAVHRDKLQPLFPSSFFTSSPAIDTLTEKTSSELALDEVSHAHTEKKGIHALDILARILKDDTIEVPYNDDDAFTKTLEANGEALFRYAGQWTLDLSDPKEVNRKVEELQWMNTIIYAIGGSQPGKKFNSDFFLYATYSAAWKVSYPYPFLACILSRRRYSCRLS